MIHTAFIGDLVLLSVLLDALAEQHPGARLALLTTPPGAALYRDDPRLERVFVYDKKGKDRGLPALWRLGAGLRAWRPHKLVSAHRSLRSALLARLSGAGERVGYRGATGSFLYTELRPDDRTRHETVRLRALADLEGPALPSLYTAPREAARVAGLLEKRGLERPVALAPASVWATKQWPAESFRQLACGLVRAGHPLVVLGAEGDRELCESVCRDLPGAHNLAGELGLRESCELLRQCSLALVNDSAPLHLAQAAGCPTWAFFGSTVLSFGFGPQRPRDRVFEIELDCRPCGRHGHRSCPLGTLACMKGIDPEAVLQEVLAFLEESR